MPGPGYFAASLVANQYTDLTGGGMPAGQGGTYMLNLCNDSDAAVSVDAIHMTKTGAPAGPETKLEPARVMEARGAFSLEPIPIADGWRVWVKASAAISAQLIGVQRG